jgi:hypothetical protein
MEITYSELDNNQNPYQNFQYNPNPNQEIYNSSEIYKNPEKYWETSEKKIDQPKKKKVSFDDILSNMNIVVNQKGVLQFMQPSPALQEQMYPHQDQQQMYPQDQQQIYQQPYQEYVAQQVAKKQQQQPLDPTIKNSFLYNKYFKDYKDTTYVQPEVRVPKTMEEYKQMLLDDRIKAIEQKKRISEIKSTKLLFTSNAPNTQNAVNHNVIKSTKNNLRRMSFN